MAKTLRTSGDYTIKTGTGASGSNTVTFDSKTTRVSGDLVVDGTSTTLNTATLTIEDPIIRLAKNNTNTVDTDSGILVERGVDNNAAFYWNEGDSVFKAVTTTSDGTGTSITDTALANIRAAEPSNTADVATKNYVDTTVGGGFSLKVAGDDSTQITVGSGNTLQFSGTNGITTAGAEPDTITISLANNLENIHSITNSSTNADLSLSANSNGSVVIDDVLTFPANRSGEPSATAVTKVFAQTPSGGGTGLFFNNTSVGSGAAGELISKKKATALAIALG
jgi:hypothetical protein